MSLQVKVSGAIVRPNPSLKRDCHRQGTWPARLLLSIIRPAGQAPSRRQPLSSNVRHHSAPCATRRNSVQNHR